MTKNIEIEFKNVITKNQYEALLKEFKLENNVFKQVNYYFDTPLLELNKQDIVLRIRQKGDQRYKLTLKKQNAQEAYEYHVILKPEIATTILKKGFNIKDFFTNDDLDYDVIFHVSLDNYRASAPYDKGTLFIDKCVYHDLTDYEVEYEVTNYQQGLESFNNFLEDHKINLQTTKRKSDRALSLVYKK